MTLVTYREKKEGGTQITQGVVRQSLSKDSVGKREESLGDKSLEREEN